MKDWDINIYRGVLTGYNEAFIIDGKTKDKLIAEDPKSAEIIHPILRGRDIKRYGYEFADKWIIFTHNGTDREPRVDVNDYPSIKSHLDQYYPKLEKRYDKGDTPYNLRSCAYTDEFFKQKIIFQEMVQEPCFHLENKGKFICSDTARIIVGNDINWLICFFNSSLFFFAIKNFYGGGGLGNTGVRMKHTFFNKFCIPHISKSDKIKLIDTISNNCHPINKVTFEVDKTIYSIYKLSKKEIEFIENQ